MRAIILMLFMSLGSFANQDNPNTKFYKVQFKIVITDAYGVELKKYTLKGKLEANRMEERCLLDLGAEVKKYLKSQLSCSLLSDQDEYFVERNEFFNLLEEMSVYKVKKKSLLKRLTGVYSNLEKNGFGVYYNNSLIEKSHFSLIEQKGFALEFRALKEPLKELIKVEIKMKQTKKRK